MEEKAGMLKYHQFQWLPKVTQLVNNGTRTQVSWFLVIHNANNTGFQIEMSSP